MEQTKVLDWQLRPYTYYWECSQCGVVGGRLGLTSKKGDRRYAFCFYCDEGTKQVAVDRGSN